MLMDRAREHETKAKEVALMAAATKGVKKMNVKVRSSVQADDSGEEGVSVGGASDIKTTRKCYRCGETGHLAKDCKLTQAEAKEK